MTAFAISFFELVAAVVLLGHGEQFAAGLAFAFGLSIIVLESAGNYWRRTCTPFS